MATQTPTASVLSAILAATTLAQCEKLSNTKKVLPPITLGYVVLGTAKCNNLGNGLA